MKKLALLFLLLSLSLDISSATAQMASAAAATGPTVSRYTLLLMGNKAGFETSALNPDGSLQLYFELNDRGRGRRSQSTSR